MDNGQIAVKKSWPPVSAWMEEKDGELKDVLAKLVEYESELHRTLDRVIEYLDGSGGSVDKAPTAEPATPAGYPPDWPAQAERMNRIVVELDGHVGRAREMTAQRMASLKNLITG